MGLENQKQNNERNGPTKEELINTLREKTDLTEPLKLRLNLLSPNEIQTEINSVDEKDRLFRIFKNEFREEEKKNFSKYFPSESIKIMKAIIDRNKLLKERIDLSEEEKERFLGMSYLSVCKEINNTIERNKLLDELANINPEEKEELANINPEEKEELPNINPEEKEKLPTINPEEKEEFKIMTPSTAIKYLKILQQIEVVLKDIKRDRVSIKYIQVRYLLDYNAFEEGLKEVKAWKTIEDKTEADNYTQTTTMQIKNIKLSTGEIKNIQLSNAEIRSIYTKRPTKALLILPKIIERYKLIENSEYLTDEEKGYFRNKEIDTTFQQGLYSYISLKDLITCTNNVNKLINEKKDSFKSEIIQFLKSIPANQAEYELETGLPQLFKMFESYTGPLDVEIYKEMLNKEKASTVQYKFERDILLLERPDLSKTDKDFLRGEKPREAVHILKIEKLMKNYPDLTEEEISTLKSTYYPHAMDYLKNEESLKKWRNENKNKKSDEY